MHQRYPWELLYVSIQKKQAQGRHVHTWTQLVDLVLAGARVELFVVQLPTVCVYGEGCHDLLLDLVGARYVKRDLLGRAVEFDVELVDLDVSLPFQTRAEAISLEDIGGEYTQWGRCQ